MSRNGNYLYYGDNLDVLRRHVKDDSIDLVYLDPPFKSNKDYNVLFVEQSGARAAAQIKAFEDTWRWDQEAAVSFQRVVEAGGRTAQALRALRGFLGENDMLAYLSMMAPRLNELKRVLKPTGSIFLHCDPTAGHYLKVLMDAVFGPPQFRNEIAWCYHGPGSPGLRQFLRKHDTIFWYSNSQEWTFNADAVRVPHKEKTRANFKPGLVGSGFTQGERTLIHKQGKVPEDWWVIAIAPRGKEYLGYPTQKPRALLERIIRAASNPGDTILDPFCGCGTTIEMAHRLDRKWIGIDITHLAINLIRHRLQEADGTSVGDTYRVIGEPVTVTDAEELARDDAYQFQWWALGLVGARPVEQKKGADRGIDGRLYFHEGDESETLEIILSVKGGKTGAADVRDLRGVVEREQAALGVFITLKEPTKPMKREAASAGFYESTAGRLYPKLQILTIAQLLAGTAIEYPVTGAGIARPPITPEQLVLTEQRAVEPKDAEREPMIDLAAELLRRTAEQRPPVDLRPILEDLNIEVRTDPTVKEDARLVAMTPPIEGQRPGAWTIYLNPNRPETRKRYTIAHELGHVALHGESHSLATAARGARGRRTSREREVERFAARLLMPEQSVRAAVGQYGADIENLSALFQVGRKAMEIRLRELGLG